MPEKLPRFDFFKDAHFGFGLRWRKSQFFAGYDFSVALPFCCFLFSTGRCLVKQ